MLMPIKSTTPKDITPKLVDIGQFTEKKTAKLSIEENSPFLYFKILFQLVTKLTRTFTRYSNIDRVCVSTWG